MAFGFLSRSTVRLESFADRTAWTAAQLAHRLAARSPSRSAGLSHLPRMSREPSISPCQSVPGSMPISRCICLLSALSSCIATFLLRRSSNFCNTAVTVCIQERSADATFSPGDSLAKSDGEPRKVLGDRVEGFDNPLASAWPVVPATKKSLGRVGCFKDLRRICHASVHLMMISQS